MTATTEVVVTRKEVIGPPDRFIDVSDTHLIQYFKAVFPPNNAEAISKAFKLMEGISSNEFSYLRRHLEGDFELFDNAATKPFNTKTKTKLSPEKLDFLEVRFLSHLTEALEQAHYKLVSKAEWDAAQAEDFLLTLPVDVNWTATDDTLLKRYWSTGGPERAEQWSNLPHPLADRVLLFRRGVSEARMSGRYIAQKVDLLISYWLLSPLYEIVSFLLSLVGLKPYMPPPVIEDPSLSASGDGTGTVGYGNQSQQNQNEEDLHDNAIRVERRTFARAFPTGKSILTQLLKPTQLQEATYKDLVLIYRKSVPDVPTFGEFDIITKADPEITKRNINIKYFTNIPLADLECVMPEKRIFVPPNVFVNLAVTAVMGVMAVVSMLMTDKLSWGVVGSAVTLLGTRAMAVWSSINVQKTSIERAMQNLLYDRCQASQSAVIMVLIQEMAKQRSRELFIAYCVLLDAFLKGEKNKGSDGATTTTTTTTTTGTGTGTANTYSLSNGQLSPIDLDIKCENLLKKEFGLAIDFTHEDAVDKLLEWGLIEEIKTKTSSNGDGGEGYLKAVPLHTAIRLLNDIWDKAYDGEMPGSKGDEDGGVVEEVIGVVVAGVDTTTSGGGGNNKSGLFSQSSSFGSGVAKIGSLFKRKNRK